MILRVLGQPAEGHWVQPACVKVIPLCIQDSEPWLCGHGNTGDGGREARGCQCADGYWQVWCQGEKYCPLFSSSTYKLISLMQAINEVVLIINGDLCYPRQSWRVWHTLWWLTWNRTLVMIVLPGACVFLLPPGGCRRAAGCGDGQHRGGGLLWGGPLRGLPQSTAQLWLQDPQE